MRRCKQLSLENADSAKEKIQKSLAYFHKWNAHKNDKKKILSKEEIRSKTHITWFLAPQSYLNLRMGAYILFITRIMFVRFKENLM